ncbi:MAG TPA: non-homologous end-joining DNA ligase [Candidatus Thermoplasmatota archaeon]|nr:non-homologous end-joining DNA ligase [Candidatus Thermoplasmatota archaeon]
MLALPAAALPEPREAYAFEFKWDGMRALVELRGGRVRIVSRNDLDQTERFPELAGMAAAVGRNATLDGEIVVFDKGRPDFGRLQNRFGLVDRDAIAKQALAHPADFLAFDLLRLDGRDLRRLPYRERRRELEALALRGPSWATTPSVAGDGNGVLQESRKLGLEGVMAKRLDAPYVEGRSEAWLKVRNRSRQEFVVGGWSTGEGMRASLGSLYVGFYPERGGGDGWLRFAGSVGSGLRDRDIERLRKELARLASPASPFLEIPPDYRKDIRFVKPSLVAEVEFNGLARSGVLRQASFKGLRTDKDPKDVVWEQA